MARKEPLTGRRPTSVKPEKARQLIRKFHVLLKTQAQAKERNDTAEIARIEQEIEKLGGLRKYQVASICGQSKQRGGDSSKILVEWIKEKRTMSLLEIGCLRVDNACSRSGLFEPHVRIDLNSQHPQIRQQDFMKMEYEHPFDVLSLSLVVNFVPDAAARGKMLLRAHQFLVTEGLLFFVLPRACVDNSRYCNDDVLNEIFTKIGFDVEQTRKTPKLGYWLLKKNTTGQQQGCKVPKRKVRDGASMNNFAIIIE